VLFAVLACLVVAPAAASADSISLRIEAKSGTLFPETSLVLPTSPVKPANAPDGQTCAAGSVISAVDAATNGDWSGTWPDQTGSSLDRIKTATATLPGRKWLVLVNGTLINDSPCNAVLHDRDNVIIYPACLTATTNCFTKGPLELWGPATAGPGAPIIMQVWETNVTLDPQGNGTAIRAPSASATVSGPDGWTASDGYYEIGRAVLAVAEKGPAAIYASKGSYVPDRLDVCVTDGADGYCGTSLPPPVPFDPYAFCKTTGNDGYCNSPDHVAPLGRIGTPPDGLVYPKTQRPQKVSGTVDFDPSQTDHVDLKLMRKTTITVNKVVKRKVWVKKKVHGKVVRKRVTRRRTVRVKKAACFGWNVATSTWKELKSCDVTTAPKFTADGAEVWSYSFLNALPAGRFTLQALAQDGAGNVDATPELGRNAVSFTVN
jgi:hypothetical protein